MKKRGEIIAVAAMVPSLIAILTILQPTKAQAEQDGDNKSAQSAVDLRKGKAVFETTCFACHGTDGSGVIPGTPNFSSKKGPLHISDAELMKNVWEGFKSPGSPLAMPPKGGNPNLTKDELWQVIQYIRKTFGESR
jgi:cytochrome c5